MAEVRTERVIYMGHVQGVGFRYTVRSLARRHPVAGYVKNLPDGSVELVAQGTPPAIDALLVEVAGQFSGNIRHCAREQIRQDEQLSGFEIRF